MGTRRYQRHAFRSVLDRPTGQRKRNKRVSLALRRPRCPDPGLCLHRGIFYAIPATYTSVTIADLEIVDNHKKAGKYVVKNRWRFVPIGMDRSILGPGRRWVIALIGTI